MSILTATTSLLFVDLLTRCRLSNCFAISDLWLTDVSLNTKLALHPIDNDFKMQLAHAGDDCLTGFLIG